MKKFLLVLTVFAGLLISCPNPNGSSSGNNPINPVAPVTPDQKALVVFDNTYGLCTAIVYDDYRRRSEDKIAEVPAGQRSQEIEYYPGDSTPFYFAYVISLNGYGGFTMNYVPKNGKDQRIVNVKANALAAVSIPKLDETFSSADQLLSPRGFLLLRNESSYSFELHRGRASIKPDGASGSPLVNSGERAFYTIDPGAAVNYRLLVTPDYKEFPDFPGSFEAGHFYGFSYNGAVSLDTEIPIKIDAIAIKEYTVTFDANGADGTAPAAQTAKAASAITLPNGGGLSKDGYTFGGWNASASGAEINYGAGASYTVTGGITLYATWRPLGTVTYTAAFDSDGGNATAAQEIVSGMTAFRPPDPVRRGHIFAGWYGSPGLTEVYSFSSPVTGDITLYAKWEPILYTVVFNANGANGQVPAALTANAGSAVTLPGGGLSKPGYGFGGWSIDIDDSSGEVYGAGASYTPDGDTTLFARWNLLPYTVTFYSNGGSAVPSQSVHYGTEVVRPADPARNGYMFIGWYSDTGLTAEYDFSSKVIGNTALYAKWRSLINGIRLNKYALILDVDETEMLSAALSTGNTLIETVTWSSDNDTVATVSRNGTVKAVAGGSAMITASTEGGLKTAQCVVTVNSIVSLSAIAGVTAPATAGTPATTITETAQYAGTVTWSPSVLGVFAPLTAYTATITLTAKTGYTLKGVDANFFTVAGATAVSNTASSGVITAVFPPTAVISSNTALQTYLSRLPDNTADTAYTVKLNVNDLGGNYNTNGSVGKTLIDNNAKYVSLDLSGSTFTSIVERAFYNCTSLTSVTIPNSVTSIGDRAFYNCSSLTSVTIPNNVTSIGDYAFNGCSSLTAINVGADNSAYSSADGILYNKTKTTLIQYPSKKTDTAFTIPNSVTSIGAYAFTNCTSLVSVTIPNGVTSIGGGAFSGCTSLAGVTIPNSVTSIGGSAFSGCTGLTGVTIPDSVTSIEGSAFNGCTRLTGATIPNSVTSIGANAFNGCSSLTSITIPNSVTGIDKWAFRDCTNLTSVTIGSGLASIGDEAFSGCTVRNLTIGTDKITDWRIIFNGSYIEQVIFLDSVTSIRNSAFRGCSGLTSVTIGSGVTSIWEQAFAQCTSLTGVTIPDSVTRIDAFAFTGCTSLTSVTIGNGVIRIRDNAFRDCTSLTSVTIGNSVTTIDGNAFGNCTSLTSITIPNSVTSIVAVNGTTASGTFNGCTNLTTITVTAGNTEYSSQDGVLYNKAKTLLILYPTGKTGAFTIPDSVTSIGERAFQSCTGLTSVTIPNNVTRIGYYAFSRCTSLISVNIPDSVTTIDGNAFYNCTNLASVIIGNGVTTIVGNAFWGCSSLTSITIPDNVTTIGSQAFRDCTSLTSITIGNKITTIEAGAFRGCTSLTSVTIPNSVTSVGAYTFDGCTSLTSITIGNSVTTIEAGVFRDCTNLTSVTFERADTTIDNLYFPGDLRDKYLAGGTGTYKRESGGDVWTKKP